MGPKTFWLICLSMLLLISNYVIDSSPSLELKFRLDQQNLFEELSANIEDQQPVLQDKINIDNQLMSFLDYKTQKLEEHKQFLESVDPSALGSSNIQLEPAKQFIDGALKLLENAKQTLTDDVAFSEAWYEVNKEIISYMKNSAEMLSNEISAANQFK
ncbi:hypothetical protein HELRODRAFT_177968 [Helobdella robusta]|uniref:Prolyl 4-hydroxylase alpha-subunit N-terminal domain-containing protein n=1 Tax=Helobdella robusta TaxID=6412 RepID=T1FCJ4_HELRO|nr:hypothetical protein HELRODRAFT_177968 [Helobdella robusta]ESN97537.1 hypothetical protein HELRODRAFT_177968 [Helobdella robusta]